jgi:hypothetical protein
MNNRRIILFLLCGIALCSALLWNKRIFPVEDKPRESLTGTTLDAVERMTIERGDTRIGLDRTAGQWALTAPFPAHVEQGTVARLLDAFESARVKDALAFQEIRKRELSLREFGLSPARMQVTLESPQRRDVFLFGALTPTGNEVYLRVNEESRILVVSAALHDAIPKTADDLRSRKLLHGRRDAARTLEVRSPGQPFIALSRETGTWRLVQPVAAPASDEQVEALLDVLYGTRVCGFVWPTVSNVMDVAEAESAVKTRMGLYGLGPDTGLQISVQEAGAAQPARLTLGHPLDGSAGLSYVLLPGGEAIGAVSNAVAEAFRLSAAGLRDPRPFGGPASGVRRLQIHMGDARFVLTQTNATWRFEVPAAEEADQAAVRETLERLLRLKAESLHDGGAGSREGEHERSMPVSYVELAADQGSWRFMIEHDDLEGRFLNLTFTNAPTVFRVAASNVPPALIDMRGLLGLRDRRVLALPRASLRRITVRREEESAAVERGNGDAAWRLSGNSSGRISSGRLEALVGCLENLRADRIEGVGLAPEQFAAYGLREPWLEVSADVEAKDAVRKVLLVGREAGFGKRYAAVRGLDVLFVLDAPTLETLSARFVEPLE